MEKYEADNNEVFIFLKTLTLSLIFFFTNFFFIKFIKLFIKLMQI